MHGQSIAVAITDVHVHSSSLQTSGPARGWNIPLWMPLPVMQGIIIFWLLSVVFGVTRLLVGIQRTRRMVNAAVIGLGRWGKSIVASSKATRFRIIRGVSMEPDLVSDFSAQHGFELGT